MSMESTTTRNFQTNWNIKIGHKAEAQMIGPWNISMGDDVNFILQFIFLIQNRC